MITHKGNSSRLLLLFGLLASTISPTQAVGILLPRSSDTCPSDYTQCSSSGLPSTFCCPSSSTCISLDDGSSAICCPAGQSCDYIEPITCDVQLQNATSHPKNSVHTTRLDDSLAKCGSKCCPFGYTCTGDSLCSMDTSTASTAAASSATSSTTSSTTSSSSSSSSSLATAISATDPRVSTSSAADNTNTNTTSSATATQLKCPQYPTAAVLAGFFPGALLGVTATLLSLLLYRHHRRKNLPPSAKIAQFTHRSSKGTLIGISSPMPSEETAYRTDFLLRRTQSRASKATTTGSRSRSRSRSRSMIQKTGGRVRSLFNPHNPVYQREGTTARGVGGGAGVETALVPERGGGSRVPVPVPPLPLNINGNLVVKQTQQDGKGGVATYSSPPVIPALPRTESIRVYTPPGVFATTGVLKPDAYPTNPRAMEAFSEDPEGSGGGGGGLSRGSSRLGSQRR